MNRQSLKSQAALITGSGAAVRALGFLMRLYVSRRLGAEAMGLMELASGVHALALTPVLGLTGAVSRLTARAENERAGQRVLFAGRQTARRIAWLIMPLLLIFSPWIARWMGDERVLPSLWFSAPCVLFIGLSGVYDGFCLGKSSAFAPSMSELSEQIARGAALIALSPLFPRVTPAWRAGLAAAAGMVGEGIGLAAAALLTGKTARFRGDPALKAVRREIRRLSLPAALNRLSHSGLRALSNWMIPLRLSAAGMMHREAMSRLGMLNGMVMPLMFLPCLLAGALAAVGGPAAARCRSPEQLKRLFFRMLLPAFGAGGFCAAGLYALSPWIAQRVYRLPELSGMIRALCPMAVLLPVQQALSGMMTGLGLQKLALRHALLGAAATLLFTYRWTAATGILGAGFAAMLGHGLTGLCTFLTLAGRIFFHRTDKHTA